MADRTQRTPDDMMKDSNEANRGIQAVADALVYESYPMDRHEVDYAVGDIAVEDGKGGFTPVRDLTDRFEKDRFDSAEEVIEAIRSCSSGTPMPQMKRKAA